MGGVRDHNVLFTAAQLGENGPGVSQSTEQFLGSFSHGDLREEMVLRDATRLLRSWMNNAYEQCNVMLRRNGIIPLDLIPSEGDYSPSELRSLGESISRKLSGITPLVHGPNSMRHRGERDTWSRGLEDDVDWVWSKLHHLTWVQSLGETGERCDRYMGKNQLACTINTRSLLSRRAGNITLAEYLEHLRMRVELLRSLGALSLRVKAGEFDTGQPSPGMGRDMMPALSKAIESSLTLEELNNIHQILRCDAPLEWIIASMQSSGADR